MIGRRREVIGQRYTRQPWGNGSDNRGHHFGDHDHDADFHAGFHAGYGGCVVYDE